MGLLMLIGLIIIYAIGPQRANVLNNSYGSEYSDGYFFTKQMVSLALALLAFGLMTYIPYRLVLRNASRLLIIGLALCAFLAVAGWAHLGIAQASLGAVRWFNLGPLGSLQPAEILKFGMVIFVASFAGVKALKGKINNVQETLVPIAVVTALALLFVVIIQKDLGTGIAISSIVASILTVGGLNKKIGMIVLIAGLVAGLLFIAFEPHRIDRVTTFLKGDNTSTSAAGSYHIEHAKIAIGTGG
jgi:cell division protein FtsW (lipid II flippase)